MGYNDDPYRDEDGEPLVDFDNEVQSDHEAPLAENDNNWDQQFDRSPTPVYDDLKSKPRKRLIKKSAGKESTPDLLIADDVDDGYAGVGGAINDYDDGALGMTRDDSEDGGGPSSSFGGGKRKMFDGGKEKKKRREKGGDHKKFKVRKNGGYSDASRLRDEEGDPDMKEMWDTIAPGDPEDGEGARTADDDNFIDDTGVDPSDRYYGSDNEPPRSPPPEASEDDEEINKLFKSGKKKKKNEKSAAEISLLVENVMAQLEVVAEDDAELNRQNKPAINKLKKLPLLTDVLSKKQLQQEFLDHGVLTLLKNWLEPLPDGSLPNINIRAAVLRILSDFPIDLEQFDRREQLKKSGLGKVIMFLSKSDEETSSNRKLAKELVDKWSRPIFNKSTRFEDMRNHEEERAAFRRPSLKRPSSKSGSMDSRDDDLDLSQGPKAGPSSSRMLHASRPEAMSMDFVVRPQSKVDPDEVRARGRHAMQNQKHLKMNKRMQQLKGPKRKQLQATKLSVEGRGMVKYL
ncbi:hypothetical protein Leryth_010856 [Lithospermum erythrorhizon]|nr:hypothetical protein Leryth_010856 [Lithospermum erythrorhizon]